MERRLFEEIAALEPNHWWLVGRSKLLLKLLDRQCRQRGGPVERLIDVGSGTGALLEKLSPYAREAIGVDTNDFAVELCRRRGLNVQHASAEHLPFPDGSVDVVTAFDVLEHVPDDTHVSCEFCRVLRPGGEAVVAVPAFTWLWSGHDVAHGHLRRYTKRSLVRCLENGGLRVTRAGYFNSFLLPLAVVKRLISRLIRQAPRSDLRPVPRWLNTVLLHVFVSESRLMLAGRLPAGLSLFAVAEHPVERV